mmetsp:Transcript_99992/g.250690  ORF Transcript_99992/g.250690 Transcript_99992/m.250690 type:complete len:359 (+) Transcript_99992:634-1710(+)
MRLGEPQDRQERAGRGVRLPTVPVPRLLLIPHADVCIHNVSLEFIVNKWLKRARLANVVAHEGCIEGLEVIDAIGRRHIITITLFLVIALLEVAVYLADVQRKVLVLFAVHRVQEQKEQIKAREECWWQVDVFNRRFVRIVPTKHRICRCQDSGPAIQRCRDARLGYRDGLLLHDLMDRGAIALLHLVKLVNATNAHVRQHEGPTLKRDLARGVVANYRSCEAHPTGAFAGGVDGPRCDVDSLLHELTLGDSGVAHEECVNVTADPHPVLHLLSEGTHQHEQEGLLHVRVAEDLGGDGAGGLFVHVALRHGFSHSAAEVVLILSILVVATFVFPDAVGVDVHLLLGAGRPCLLVPRHG